ncbi:hypothetical protein HK102_006300 [Quaeritorhiza haematococci]|nr:hypothetical protein HK102_006300 [Quaeritorhiza haematococci]
MFRLFNFALVVALTLFYPTIFVLLWQFKNIALATAVRQELQMRTSTSASESLSFGSQTENFLKTGSGDGSERRAAGEGERDDGDKQVTEGGSMQHVRESGQLPSSRPAAESAIENNSETSREELIKKLNLYVRRSQRSYCWKLYWAMWAPFILYSVIVTVFLDPTPSKPYLILVMRVVGMAIAATLLGQVIKNTKKDSLGIRASLSVMVIMFVMNMCFSFLKQFGDPTSSNFFGHAASMMAMTSLWIILIALITVPAIASLFEKDLIYEALKTSLEDTASETHMMKGKRISGLCDEIESSTIQKTDTEEKDDVTVMDVITGADPWSAGGSNASQEAQSNPFGNIPTRNVQHESDFNMSFSHANYDHDKQQQQLDNGKHSIAEVSSATNTHSKAPASWFFFVPFSLSVFTNLKWPIGFRRGIRRGRGRHHIYKGGLSGSLSTPSLASACSSSFTEHASLEHTLSTPELSVALSNFLAREFAMENLLFLKAVNRYRAVADKIARKLRTGWEVRTAAAAPVTDVVSGILPVTTGGHLSISSPTSSFHVLDGVSVGRSPDESLKNIAHADAMNASITIAIPPSYVHLMEPYLLVRAQGIADQFLRPGSSNEINIPAALRKSVLQEIDEAEARASSNLELSAAMMMTRQSCLLAVVPPPPPLPSMPLPPPVLGAAITGGPLVATLNNGVASVQLPIPAAAPIPIPTSNLPAILNADTFQNAEDHVRWLLRTDVMPRFRKTVGYRKAMKSIQHASKVRDEMETVAIPVADPVR